MSPWVTDILSYYCHFTCCSRCFSHRNVNILEFNFACYSLFMTLIVFPYSTVCGKFLINTKLNIKHYASVFPDQCVAHVFSPFFRANWVDVFFSALAHIWLCLSYHIQFNCLFVFFFHKRTRLNAPNLNCPPLRR